MTVPKCAPHSKPVAAQETADEVLITPVTVTEAKGSPWLRELYEYFAPVRAEAIEKGYTEEEINAQIDRAIAEARRRRE